MWGSDRETCAANCVPSFVVGAKTSKNVFGRETEKSSSKMSLEEKGIFLKLKFRRWRRLEGAAGGGRAIISQPNRLTLSLPWIRLIWDNILQTFHVCSAHGRLLDPILLFLVCKCTDERNLSWKELFLTRSTPTAGLGKVSQKLPRTSRTCQVLLKKSLIRGTSCHHISSLYISIWTWTGLLLVGRVGEKSLKTDLAVTKNFLVMVINQFLGSKGRVAFISGMRIRGYWKLQSYLHLYKSLIPLNSTKPTISYSSYFKVYTKFITCKISYP